MSLSLYLPTFFFLSQPLNTPKMKSQMPASCHSLSLSFHTYFCRWICTGTEIWRLNLQSIRRRKRYTVVFFCLSIYTSGHVRICIGVKSKQNKKTLPPRSLSLSRIADISVYQIYGSNDVLKERFSGLPMILIDKGYRSLI